MSVNLLQLANELAAAGLTTVTGVAFNWTGATGEANTTYYSKDGGTVRVSWSSSPSGGDDTTASGVVSAHGGAVLTAVSFPAGYIYGFQLLRTGTHTLTIGPASGVAGICRDADDLVTIKLPSQGNVSVTIVGANGMDAFVGPGTVSASAGSPTVTGTSTTFLTSFGTRAITGTISSSSTTVTGSGTKFSVEAAFGDLIGNATKGYFQVTAIASDTSLTIATTPGSAFSASSANVIENPTITTNNDAYPRQVKAIASDTSLTMVANSAGVSSVNYTIGEVYRTSFLTAVQPASSQIFLHVWAFYGDRGTTCCASTQRTTPFQSSVTGYTASRRRLGAVLYDGGGTGFVPFAQTGAGALRRMQYFFGYNTVGCRVITGAAATTWTTIVCSAVAPPTAIAIAAVAYQYDLAGQLSHFVQKGLGPASNNSTLYTICANSAGSSTHFVCPCDTLQRIDYANSSSSLHLAVDVMGYDEYL